MSLKIVLMLISYILQTLLRVIFVETQLQKLKFLVIMLRDMSERISMLQMCTCISNPIYRVTMYELIIF